MKNIIKYFLLLLIGVVAFTSCNDKDDIEIIDEVNTISLYEVNKSIVSINTTNIAAGFETVFSESILDSTERALFSQTFVNGARFYEDASGYFYIETMHDAWVIAHINLDIIGTSRINIQDDYGKFFIQEMIETVRYKGHGFVDYYRINPTNQEYERKLGYVTGIPAADWFIGTGFYGGMNTTQIDEYDAKKMIVKESVRTLANGISTLIGDIYTEEEDAINFCREFIDHMRYFDDGSGYFFINDLDGINIAHGANEESQGSDDLNIQDTNGNYIIQDMISIIEEKGSGFYEYYWENPNDGEIYKKITYISEIPGTTYFIGSGFYSIDDE